MLFDYVFVFVFVFVFALVFAFTFALAFTLALTFALALAFTKHSQNTGETKEEALAHWHRGSKDRIQQRAHPQNTHETHTRAREHNLETRTES